MKLSFVIPAYNESAYIGRCLKAIINQKGGYDVEIIVVNNASTDNTAEIAGSFPEVRVVHESRKGITFARQAGFKAATGDLIANVDSDSVLTSGWIKKVFKAFSNDPDLIALSGPFIYYDLPKSTNRFVKSYYFLGWLGYLINRHILHIGSMLQGGNYIARRWAIEKIGGFDLSVSFYGEDTDMARRLNKIGKVVWTFSLPMYTSGRRLAEEGVWKMAAKYSLNYFWTTFMKRPYTKEYIDIRKR